MMGKNPSALLDDVIAGMTKMKNRVRLNLKDGQSNLGKKKKEGKGYGSINPFKKHPGEDAGK